MRKTNWNDVDDAVDFELLPAGGYVCQILRVNDETEKEYLKIEFDIAEGEYKDHYVDTSLGLKWWPGTFNKSYKDKAQRFFKAMLTAVEESNASFSIKKFSETGDEHMLERMMIGLTIGIENYWGKDGTKKQRNYVDRTRSVKAIRDGDYKMPPERENTYNKPVDGFTELPDTTDEELPF